MEKEFAMKREIIKLPVPRTIAGDYAKSLFPVRERFRLSPFHPQHLEERTRELERRETKADKSRVVDVIRRFHEPELMHPEVRRNLERLALSESLVVIGGQQAGLLGGPLYTVHKAVTVIQWARRAEMLLRRPVIPVFWIAGEDHDLAEVDHVWVRNGEGGLVKHRFPAGEEERKLPVSSRVLEPEAVRKWLKDLARILPDSVHKEDWLSRLGEWADTPVSWTRFFARVLHHLFGRWGLLLVDSADPALRRLEAPFFARLIDHAPSIQARVEEAARQLEGWGYPSPVGWRPRQGNLFLLVEGERRLLFCEEGNWFTQDGSFRARKEEMLRLASEHPERLSNNVITRPLMQDYLFPVLGVVTGPGEIAYWSLLKEAFMEAGLEMPPLIPRWSATLVDGYTAKRVEEFGLTWEEVLTHLDEKREAWLKERRPFDPGELFDRVKEDLARLYAPLIGRLDEEVGMNMREIGEKNLQKILMQVDWYRAFVERSIEAKHAAALKRWDAIRNVCVPLGRPQERVYNLVQAWNAFGLEWIDDWVSAPFPEDGEGLEHFLLHVN
jgi:bacillithiol biosynthesis cysteine-adding enzyme BshC